MRVIADGKRRFVIFETRPVDPRAITDAEFAAAKDASLQVLSTGFVFGPQASDTVDEKPLGVTGNVQALANANAAVSMTLFREFDDATGQPDPTEDWLFELHRERGNLLMGAVLDRGVPSATAVTAGDTYHYIEYLNDTPLSQDELTGYIKHPMTGLPQEYYFHQTVVADAP